eukprot:CAMPEP_0116156550 /NCGR_PEP_ID=MMETSP0329-20121206/22890_1 /TAXON_ID=697910 /ORGANISM="Pseudo-nitzschia arenysensis, Strain B593" /LENGTH=457 /DNA_ID=CAMNT_0003653637 /DNA_START=54 /DNA_END=1424 /DNA_ORIENTATION=+
MSETEDFISLMPSEDEASQDENDENDHDGNPTQQKRQQQQQQEEQHQPSNQQKTHDFDRRNGLPPWMDSYVDHRRINPLIALHNEIVGFCKLMEPKDHEMKMRTDLLAKFTGLAESIFSSCKVEVFGSQVTGLCLPTSDIDIAIQLDGNDTINDDDDDSNNNNNKTEKSKKKKKQKAISKQQELDDMKNWDMDRNKGISPLRRLEMALREEWLDDLSYLEVIEKTRIPLVKFTHAPTNISIDVCFNQTTGPQAAQLMKQYMQALSPLRPLSFVLKKYMASRGLNQPYTGGVGSFLLQMMILSFLQHRERDTTQKRRPSSCNLGALLVEFLEFYSTDFNFVLVGASVRFDGFFFPKGAKDRKEHFWQPSRQFAIAMENPLDPTMDVGSASFRIDLVQRSFEVAFKTLLCHVSEPYIPTPSILASILMPSEEMWERSASKIPDFRKQQQQHDQQQDPRG